jgi:hypothetical protein
VLVLEEQEDVIVHEVLDLEFILTLYQYVAVELEVEPAAEDVHSDHTQVLDVVDAVNLEVVEELEVMEIMEVMEQT